MINIVHMRNYLLLFLITLLPLSLFSQERPRPRDIGLKIGVLSAGKLNAITDVPGVKVGHETIIIADSIRTGVTAIIPYEGNIFQSKVPAAIFSGNGFGKLAGITQVQELGNLETPVILTNTLSVATAMEAVIDYTLAQKGNEAVQSVNAVVGETNDGWLNDIRGRHINKEHVLNAIRKAGDGAVEEGSVGAGTGTVCFGFKGGIGTSSRVLPESLGGYTVGVIVQSNFGGVLEIAGVPVGKELEKFSFSNQLLNNVDGSCMMVVATDAPLDARNLGRLARRAFIGMGKTGGIASNGSGDYVIAFSTAASIRVPYRPDRRLEEGAYLHNDLTSPLFMAAIEATEEAIINSLFAAETMKGRSSHVAEALPLDQVADLLKKYKRL
jgi:D-aminopeptidase